MSISGVHRVVSGAVASGRITLSEVEERIFALLRDVVKHFELKDTLRVAGGWVRDKLLGRESLDIDITTDTLSGSQLANRIGEYLKAHNEKDAARFKILPTPEQSAHLKVSTIKLYDLEIDLNALRTEIYDENNRIPVVSPGTILEDTARRDFTINALYYNINEDSIEDYTDTGLSDLKARIVRTPSDPFKSFKEDPLRILRAVRYAGRYGFLLDDFAKAAAKNPEVQECLKMKVSRERYGIEVEKMFKAANPMACLSILCELGLYNIVFHPPSTYHVDPSKEMVPFPYFPVPLPMIEPKLVMQASLAIAGVAETMLFSQKNTSHRSIVFHMLRNGIKLSKSSAELICHMLHSAQLFAEVSRSILKIHVQMHENGQEETLEDGRIPLPDDVRLAMAQAMVIAGPHWNASVQLCDAFAHHFHAFVIERYLPSALLLPQLEHSNLEGCWEWRPLLSGRDVMSTFGIRGPSVGYIVQQIKNWMLLNPNGNRDQCEEWLGENLSSLLDQHSTQQQRQS